MVNLHGLKAERYDACIVECPAEESAIRKEIRRLNPNKQIKGFKFPRLRTDENDVLFHSGEVTFTDGETRILFVLDTPEAVRLAREVPTLVTAIP